jgi:hypothetical protein
MNHGTREDTVEEDRYRTEHLVAVCRNTRMNKDERAAEYRGGCYRSALNLSDEIYIVL